MKTRKPIFAGAGRALLGCLFLFACTDNRVAEPEKEGNSSETVAMVAGSISNADGIAVKGAWVALVPEKFNPTKGADVPVELTAYTDAQGEFAIAKVPKGRYGLEARHPKDGTRIFHGGLDIAGQTYRTTGDTLKTPGSLRVNLPESIRAGGFLYLCGTRYAWPVTSKLLAERIFTADSVPAAAYGALAYAADTSLAGADTLARDIPVNPDDTALVGPYADWIHAAKITVNTSVTGAGVAQDLIGFPLLVRLDSTDFDFTQAASDGSDLRFLKSDGKTPQSFQIEHWDASLKQAAVWVLVDTVRGSDAAQGLQMLWGKPGVKSASDGKAVFGAAYAGVWHLEENAPGTGTDNVYRNSAADADHGKDSLSSDDLGGVIGNGHFFKMGDYVRVPAATQALKPKPAVTLSAWIKATSTDSSGGEIASMGNDYGLRIKPDGNIHVFNFNPPRTDSTDFSFDTKGINLLDGAWHFVAGIVDGTHEEIYVDGIDKGGADFPKAVLIYDGGPDFFIGNHGNNELKYHFTGYIDEVRVNAGVTSAAWFKLCFETQKPGAGAVSVSY